MNDVAGVSRDQVSNRNLSTSLLQYRSLPASVAAALRFSLNSSVCSSQTGRAAEARGVKETSH